MRCHAVGEPPSASAALGQHANRPVHRPSDGFHVRAVSFRLHGDCCPDRVVGRSGPGQSGRRAADRRRVGRPARSAKCVRRCRSRKPDRSAGARSTPKCRAAGRETIEPGATLAETVAKLRSTDAGQPRARMPRRRHLFRIQEREPRRPACGRPCHRQSRRIGPLPVELLRRGVPAQPVQLRPRPFAALRSRAPAAIGRTRSRSPRSSTRNCTRRRCGKALFFHARRVSPGWRLTRVGDARQPRLLPLISR